MVWIAALTWSSCHDSARDGQPEPPAFQLQLATEEKEEANRFISTVMVVFLLVMFSLGIIQKRRSGKKCR